VVEQMNARRADRIRAEAREHELATKEREAEALRVKAESEKAQAEAQRAQVQAERLAHEREAAETEAGRMRSDVDGRFRKADELDPRVDTGRGDSAR
jgi:hypothetical protein